MAQISSVCFMDYLLNVPGRWGEAEKRLRKKLANRTLSYKNHFDHLSSLNQVEFENALVNAYIDFQLAITLISP